MKISAKDIVMFLTTLGGSVFAFVIASIAGGAALSLSRRISEGKSGTRADLSIWKSPQMEQREPVMKPMQVIEKLAA